MSHFDDEFDEIIDRFERARRTSPAVDVADFFPPPNESHFCAIATELLRVDLQYGWQNGNPTSLHEYQRRFPSVLNNRQHLGQLAFEEFRTRRLAGHAIDAREYSRQYSIDTHNWPDVNNSTVANKSKDQSTVVSGETPATSHGVPTLKAGDTFDRFRLRKELGKGAFARVFLATQPELAERDVVLKLTAAEGTDVEPRLLAKLQHTNIVPVYSVHKDRGIFGLCMPDFGPCTLHDVLSECSLQARNRELRSGRLIADAIQQRQRSSTDKNELNNDNTGTFSSLRKSNYVDACVRLMLDVARGLEHAHAQNVVHCDIKPANILIADHGVAMLLDFNLSAEVTVDQAKRSLVGGTLPYLAPEHLSAINDGSTIPESADIYSYGAVFYELLTGQTPHQIIGPKLSPNIEKMISDRRTAPTSVKALAPEVPVSISNVIDRLLAPSPDDRYQSMGDVCDDLVNHLHDRPLQHVANPMPERLSKWKRRNPRLATGLFAMIVCLIATMFIVRAHRDHALQQSSDLFDAQSELADIRVLANIPFFDETLLQQAATQSDAAIKPFVDESEDGERLEIAPTTTLNRDAVFQCVAEHLYLSAHARRRLAERSQQANELNRRADRAEQLMATIPQQSRSAEDDLLPVYQLIADKEWESAIAQLQRLVDRYPKDGSLKALLGNSFAGDNRLREAEEQYSAYCAMISNSAVGFLLRGACRRDREFNEDASLDFTEAIRLRPDLATGWFNRGMVRASLHQYEDAIADLDEAERIGGAPSRLFFARSTCRKAIGDASGAMSDFERGLAVPPTDAADWVHCGLAILNRDEDQALSDFETALDLDPNYRSAKLNIAMVYEKRGLLEDAIQLCNEVVDQNRHYEDIAARGVLHARLGKETAAIADAETAIADPDHEAKTLYRAACIYALLAVQDESYANLAIERLGTALVRDWRLRALAKIDPDLNNLRGNAKYRRIVEIAAGEDGRDE